MVDDGVPFSHGLMWGGGDAARYEHRPDSMRLFFNAWQPTGRLAGGVLARGIVGAEALQISHQDRGKQILQ